MSNTPRCKRSHSNTAITRRYFIKITAFTWGGLTPDYKLRGQRLCGTPDQHQMAELPTPDTTPKWNYYKNILIKYTNNKKIYILTKYLCKNDELPTYLLPRFIKCNTYLFIISYQVPICYVSLFSMNNLWKIVRVLCF